MSNAFLVRLSISLWTARKLDKTATRDTKERAGATDKAAVKVYKSLIADEALDAVETIANAARSEHRRRTVPWAYDGPGAITAQGYPEYKAAMSVLEKQFHAAVAHFYSVYDQAREQARSDLKGMWNAADYPTSDSLKGRFSFAVHAEPMPDANDFRVVGLPQADVDAIKEDIADNHADAMDNANQTAWARVVEHVEKLKLRLDSHAKGEGKLYDSFIDNIVVLIALIPSINVANDPELTRIAQKLTALTAYTMAELRESAPLRAEVSKQASLILASIGEAYRRAA